MKKNDNTNPFKTPEGYFDSFQNKLMDKLSNEESGLLDFLENKNDGFKVPVGYFDGLQKNINNRLDDKVKVIPIKTFRDHYMAIASIAAVALVVVGFFWNTSDQINFADLANSDIEIYFENNDFGLSSYEIAEEIPVDQMELGDFLETRFSDEHIVDYINENIDNINELNLEDDE